MAGGTVVLPENSSMGRSGEFVERLVGDSSWKPTLGYGEPAARPGLHVMESPTESRVETLTGLGGTGVEIMLAHIGQAPIQAHPMIPLLQVSGVAEVGGKFARDLDLILKNDTSEGALVDALVSKIEAVASRTYQPMLYGRGVTNFQLTRGLLGVSL